MPSTINGIGTHYYGKSNLVKRRGQCEQCNRVGELKSYDTWYCFCVLFIPILPLGKKRIVDECPSCTRHYALPLAEWEARKKQALSETSETLTAAPDDPEALREAIGTALGFHDRETLSILHAGADEFMHDNYDVQMMFGGAWDYFGDDERACTAYRAALDARPDDEDAKRQLGLTLIDLGRPEDAAPHLAFALEAPREGHAGVPVALAQGFLAAGEAERAMDLLDHGLQLYPALNESALYRTAWKEASAQVSPERRAASPYAERYLTESGQRNRRIAFAVAALLVLVLGLYLGICAAFGMQRTVHVVSGLPVDSRVRIGEETLTLHAGTRKRITLGEGTVEVEVLEPDLDLPPETVQIATPFLWRPFVDRTFVINPDRTALLLQAQMAYTARQSIQAPIEDPRYFAGQTLHVFKNIDFPFSPFPEEITLGEGKDREYRWRIDLIRDPDPTAAYEFIRDELADEEAGVRWVQVKLRADPHNEGLLSLLTQIQTPEACVDFLRTGLDAMPTRINWHRYYQALCPQAQPEHDLRAEYQARTEAHPQNADLLYLLGRLQLDPAQARTTYAQALEIDPDHAWTLNAMAYHNLSAGRFDEALPLVQKALASQPDNPSFKATREYALNGLGRWDQRLADIRAAQQAEPEAPFHWLEQARVLLCQEKPQEARAALNEFVQKMTPPSGAAEDNLWKHFADATFAYYTGDIEGYLQSITAANQGEAPFGAFFSQGDYAQAAAQLNDDSPELDFSLLLLIAAMQTENAELEAKALKDATDALRQRGGEEARYADALMAEERPDAAVLLALAAKPDLKRLLLTTLGLRWPEDREAYFALARRLNFDRDFPYLFLQDILTRDPR